MSAKFPKLSQKSTIRTLPGKWELRPTYRARHGVATVASDDAGTTDELTELISVVEVRVVHRPQLTARAQRTARTLEEFEAYTSMNSRSRMERRIAHDEIDAVFRNRIEGVVANDLDPATDAVRRDGAGRRADCGVRLIGRNHVQIGT